MTFTRVAWLLTLGFDMLTMFAVNSCLWKTFKFRMRNPKHGEIRSERAGSTKSSWAYLGNPAFPAGLIRKNCVLSLSQSALILCNTVCGSSQHSCFSHITSRRLNLPFCQPSDSWLVQR